MLTPCGTSSGSGRRSDGRDPAALATGRPLPLQAPTAFVRIRPRGRARCGETRQGPPLPCSFASAPAAVGSRSPRPSARSSAAPAGVEIALVPITTAGDRDRTRPFGEIGERGVFVKELEEALLAGRIDVAVHSAKDMTSTDTDGLVVGAYPPREDPRDALCGAAAAAAGDADRHGVGAAARAAPRARADAVDRAAARQRRHAAAQARRARPRRDRARRVRPRPARARRRDRAALRPDELLPEAGQGALALQVRAGEEELVAAADDAETRRRVEAERRCVAAIGGGCLAPVAAHHDGATLTALVADEDGRWLERRAGDDPRRSAASWRRCRPSRMALDRHSHDRRARFPRSRHTAGRRDYRASPRGWGGGGRRSATGARALGRAVVVTRPPGRSGSSPSGSTRSVTTSSLCR